MTGKTVELAIKVAATADVDAFASVGSAARDMGSDLEAAASQADTAAGRFDGVATAADGLDSKAGAATGALGALASGFELVGADKYAAGLQSAAMATDFASGAAQAFTLITGTLSLAKIKDTATTVAHTAAVVASSTASKAAAAGQWLLNAALSANPLGAVVLLFVAVAAATVVAYQRSETFRAVVDGAMDKARAAVSLVVDRVKDIGSTVGDAIDWVQRLPDAFGAAKSKVVGFVGDMLSPITDVYNKVVALVDKIQSIHIPDLPHIPGISGRVNVGAGIDYPTADGGTAPAAPTVVNTYNITVNQTVGDPVKAARDIRDILARADRIVRA